MLQPLTHSFSAAEKAQKKTAKEVNKHQDQDEDSDEDEDYGEDNEEDDEASFDDIDYSKPSATDTDLNNIFAKMTVTKPSGGASSGAAGSGSPFSASFQYPYLKYNYVNDGRRCCTIDFLIINQGKDNFRPKITGDGTVLELGTIVPEFFFEPSRLLIANANDNKFSENTNKATAFQETAAKVTASLGEGEPLLGAPQKIKLDFKVEDEIANWEMQAFENDDEDFANDCGGVPQMFFVLTVDLIGVEKIKKEKKKGGFRLFGSPNKQEGGVAAGGGDGDNGINGMDAE